MSAIVYVLEWRTAMDEHLAFFGRPEPWLEHARHDTAEACYAAFDALSTRELEWRDWQVRALRVEPRQPRIAYKPAPAQTVELPMAPSDEKPRMWSGQMASKVPETRAQYLWRVRGDCQAQDTYGDLACCACNKSHSSESCCEHGVQE